MEIQPEEALRPQVGQALKEISDRLSSLVRGASVEHVGSTAVPGALTKGDLDVLVRVPADQFACCIAWKAEVPADPDAWRFTGLYDGFLAKRDFLT